MKKRTLKIGALILIVTLLFGLCACGKINHSRDTAVLPVMSASREQIYIVDRGALNAAEMLMLNSLQGIVAQEQAQIYIKDGDNTVFLDEYLMRYPNINVIESDNILDVVKAFIESITDSGMVLFEPGDNPTVNMAATVSGAEGWLAVPTELKNDVMGLGLSVKKDLTEKKNGRYVNTYETVFEEYKDVLCRDIVIHQSPELLTLRDYGIAAGAFCFYTDESKQSEIRFRNKVFSWMNQNGAVLGWSTTELHYVKQASKNGLFILASDHCINLSMLSAIGDGEAAVQKNQYKTIIADPTKHYVALVMSDGDNVQWFTTTVPFRGHFADRVSTKGDYKLSWTAPPLLQTLAPSVLQYVYDTATDKDRFIAGVSGMGYINPASYPEKYLPGFVAGSADAMQKSDMPFLAILDNTTSMSKLGKAMQFFADLDEISGGVMQIGNKYEELGGKVVWCGDKPFISAEMSFWYSAKNDEDTINEQYIRDFAETVNELPIDITSEDGYTYINIHPWSTSIEDVNQLVSLFDEHIEVVYTEELAQLVRKNVKH